MEESKVDMFIMTNAKFFESQDIPAIREKLIQMDESKWGLVQALDLKDPTISIIASLFAGGFGVDRFIIGDTGLGIGKLLTCGGLGIWSIVDWFLIMPATRQKNLEKIRNIIGY